MTDKDKLHKLDVPASILDGFIFPDIVSIKLMQRSDGQTRIVTIKSLREVVPAKKFDRMFSDLQLTGEYMDDGYHAIIHKQGST